ncbi:substrate-binding domain-containing protein [Desulfolucanica intricata]|uniref:substrate-binding domain-containing protein n=1 Tax=Desulfolucanica intricata TaxID=1285191 RepID=UPI00082BD8FF|nr:substrate-binding domain-containing protein [Desulfolucanica intricata]
MNNQRPRSPAACPAGFQGRYTVVSGDTMFLIARRMGIRMEDLIAANPHISDPNRISPGDVLCVPGQAAQQPAGEITLATTTSTVDTGLLDVLIPRFEEQTGYNVRVQAVGSGQALSMGSRGEADVLLTHSPETERPLVRNNTLTNYRLIMHNDFVIVGPREDPARIRGLNSAAEAFRRIARERAPFVSRGDYSGTHQKEIAIWELLGIVPGGDWYQQTKSGMAETLRTASNRRAYTLSDRGTYLAQRRNVNLDILVEGDRMLLNVYHVMQPNPQKFPQVNAGGGKAFVDFMVSPGTQRIIGEYGKDRYGQPLFIPDAGKSESEVTT